MIILNILFIKPRMIKNVKFFPAENCDSSAQLIGQVTSWKPKMKINL